ncbi:hypothetical protein A3C89_02810 [Candidatus Kaiserbacteria bacterium RIFCSPHIGHO2_02_FULL_50_50]|uniref:Uncharacterized protein n=1 Tax=Candidatus Kaiserbacteria bacterium RIFCSPHIGHO2_02_FULL_50_50 TaxID=1798492 RepID=A0A1F6DDD3_9BACT|nr:MAG: hypothetical protein A3C89_02810 [Candidatus Kaiserbacteria bacterium RIFCSPHIGHO2_02_FULL_50_50]OGG89138.1 MAG: hypothetical protein A3G62_00120 [Candidatus Kaiserbacteria bacterium RIFCSPLOWO2_12_FULL_50_10]
MTVPTTGIALIPLSPRERHAPDARLVVILEGKNLHARALDTLSRRHHASAHVDRKNNKAFVSVPCVSMESALSTLVCAGIKMKRDYTTLERIAEAEHEAAKCEAVVCH